jgi:glycogen synthase
MMTPHQPYEWAQSSIHNLNFDFVTENEYKEEERLLSSQFATAQTVRGTQQLHEFMPVKKGVLNTKMYYYSPNYTENCVISVLKDIIKLKDITGFATCMYVCMILSGG